MIQTPPPMPEGMKKMSATEAAVASFFAIAQEDLEASMVLYDNKLYRPAILLLQQAIEKAVKSLALQIGVIELDGVKGLGHNPQKAYTDLIIQLSNDLKKSMKDIEKREEMQIALAFIGEDVRKLMDTFEEFKTQALRTAAAYNRCNISEEEVYALLTVVDEMNQEFFDLDQVIQDNLGEKVFNGRLIKVTTAVKIFLYLIPMNPEGKKNMNSKIDEIAQQVSSLGELFESFFILIISQITAAFSLFYLSLLTAPHAMVARYPNATKENIDPLEFYTDEAPLIANLQDILWFTEYTFDQMERFYSHLTYLPEIQKEVFPRKEKAPQLLKKSNPNIQGGNAS
ncbi:HEPN domain-containing protein [Methanogenium sp. MK-MG]|uniref:HEPN domain-containing protein n=1 Tax=Methanogenium sp. MK-MG TaxID=2599926 RepID=UPI0013EA2ACD|nr:HEPN domain-containing protein [Methanogenium sp. MK-MG]KAF1078225.1 hypothetical protein MKMG_00882 [Methanogenium sp. MK-MG]